MNNTSLNVCDKDNTPFLGIQFCMFYVKFIHYFEVGDGVNQRLQTNANREKWLALHRQLFPETRNYLIARGIHGETLEKFVAEWYNPVMEALFPDIEKD